MIRETNENIEIGKQSVNVQYYYAKETDGYAT
jgi:hypothetical protein